MIIKSVKEKSISDVKFHQHKFTEKQRPDPKDVVIICCFSEFGCETLGPLYGIPKLKSRNPDKYFVAAGWFGRSYLYRHLVDEYWEIDEDFQFLREDSRAFHCKSKSIPKIENGLAQFGTVIPSVVIGNMIVGCQCKSCEKVWQENKEEKCPHCGGEVERSVFGDLERVKKTAVPIPFPSRHHLDLANTFVGDNSVGIFARNRKCYGRNLPPEFYVNLIDILEKRGYTPIWLGEKQSTLPCPLPHIIDFSRDSRSRDLELTCAIVSKLKFTIQFWTASTRLASIVGTPFILFESPDQIVGQGQEGMRINLTTNSKNKLIYNHYLNVLNNQPQALKIIDRAIDNVEKEDWSDEMGLLENETIVRAMVAQSGKR